MDASDALMYSRNDHGVRLGLGGLAAADIMVKHFPRSVALVEAKRPKWKLSKRRMSIL